MDDASPVNTSSTPAAIVAIDCPCIGCDYNLRGLSDEGRCPECGQLVAPSLIAQRERGWSAASLRRVRRVIVLLLASMVMAALAGLLYGNGRGRLYSTLFLWFICVPAMSWIGATVAIAIIPETAAAHTFRRLAFWLAVAAIGMCLLHWFATLTAMPFRIATRLYGGYITASFLLASTACGFIALSRTARETRVSNGLFTCLRIAGIAMLVASTLFGLASNAYRRMLDFSDLPFAQPTPIVGYTWLVGYATSAPHRSFGSGIISLIVFAVAVSVLWTAGTFIAFWLHLNRSIATATRATTHD